MGNPNVKDAELCRPVRDWALAALFASLLNTNSPHELLSVNDPNTNAWLGALGGLSVLTNISVQPSQPPQFDTLLMSSNSPQAASVTASILATRASQPGGVFRNVGALLASPALSMASPWLNQSAGWYGISDDAYERIPSQLLSLVRADSVGALVSSNGNWIVQFSGFDSCSYALDQSSDLLNWTTISTHYPTNGVFSFPVSGDRNQFFRSRLLP